MLLTIDPLLATTEEQYTPLHYAAYYVPPYEVDTVGSEQTDTQNLRDHLTSSKKTMEFLMSVAGIDVSFCVRDLLYMFDSCYSHDNCSPVNNYIFIIIVYEK